MSKGPETEEDEVEEEAANSKTKEVFDKGAWVFVEALNHDVVLQSGDYGKVKGKEGKNGLKEAIGKPEGAESGQHKDNGDNDERDVVAFHFELRIKS